MTLCHWRYRLNKLAKIRSVRVQQQNGVCYYCRQPMCSGELSEYASRYGMTLRAAARLQATAEHLVARCEGGSDTLENIVAACRFCNSIRHFAKHPLPPEAYGEKARKRLSRGKWHGFIARSEAA